MSLEVGQIFTGKITGISKFGAFVSLPENKSGMVHISEVSSDYVKDINEHVSEGQEVTVKILGIDDKGRISLSMSKAKEPVKKTVTFEDLMCKFKSESDEKMSDLKRVTETKRGGFSRKGSGKY